MAGDQPFQDEAAIAEGFPVARQHFFQGPQQGGGDFEFAIGTRMLESTGDVVGDPDQVLRGGVIHVYVLLYLQLTAAFLAAPLRIPAADPAAFHTSDFPPTPLTQPHRGRAAAVAGHQVLTIITSS
jgi:hypothetical protein